MFADSAVIKTGLVSSIFGAYFGILYDSYFLKGTPSTLNHTSLLKGILRMILGAAVLLPFTLPYFLLSDNIGVGGLYFLKTSLPFFCLNFVMFSYLKVIFQKINIVNINHYY